jgi:hypothetical protein
MRNRWQSSLWVIRKVLSLHGLTAAGSMGEFILLSQDLHTLRISGFQGFHARRSVPQPAHRTLGFPMELATPTVMLDVFRKYHRAAMNRFRTSPSEQESPAGMM